MDKQWTDYLATVEQLPEPWMNSVTFIHHATMAPASVEAEKLKNQMLLLGTQTQIALHIEQQRAESAAAELQAAELRASASDKIARSVLTATWLLAGATIALVIATLVLAVRGS